MRCMESISFSHDLYSLCIDSLCIIIVGAAIRITPTIIDTTTKDPIETVVMVTTTKQCPTLTISHPDSKGTSLKGTVLTKTSDQWVTSVTTTLTLILTAPPLDAQSTNNSRIIVSASRPWLVTVQPLPVPTTYLTATVGWVRRRPVPLPHLVMTREPSGVVVKTTRVSAPTQIFHTLTIEIMVLVGTQ